jgi:pyruvate formate-lyase/glycerol dehydratase family glycyl radical enzyme
MKTELRGNRVCTEERFKKAMPFEWGYGSTPRTNKLRKAVHWKGAVTESILVKPAEGLGKTGFRKGIRMDMDRARIVTAALRETDGQPVPLQYARMVEKLCEEMPVFIKDGELIVGDPNGGAHKIRWYPETNVDWMPEAVTTGGFSQIVTEEERREILDEICPFWERRSTAALIKSSLPEEMAPTITTYGSVVMNVWEQGLVIPAWDFEVLFREGLAARIAKAEARLAELDTRVQEMDPAEYLAKRYEWQAMARCGRAIIRYGHRLSEITRQQAAQERDAKRRTELEEMADILEHVPAHPPRTFHECLQFYWTVEVAAHYFAHWGYGSGVRFDQVWWPYYQADIESGRITREDAVELVECLFLKIQEIGAPLEWPPKFAGVSGANTMYTANIGGVTDDGEDATNELSFIVLEALGNLHLSQPPVAVQYHAGISPELISAATDLCRTGLGHPSYFNMDLLTRWAIMRGFSVEDSRRVMPIACASYSVKGTGMLASGLAPGLEMNCPAVLNEVLHLNDQEARCGPVVSPAGKKATEMQSADEIMKAYFERLKYYVRIFRVSWNIAQQVLMERKPDPCYSLLLDETLQRGIDVVQSHKDHDTWPEVTPFGSINVVNSLAAIQRLVFDERKYTMEHLLRALDANWSGHEAMRQEFLNAPKYGNDDDFADGWARRFLIGQWETVSKFKDAWGYCLTMDGSTAAGHTMMGLVAPASPDGRLASTSLADGSRSPMAGTDNAGPTAVLNSVGKVPFMHSELFNQRFMHTFLEGENKKLFADYLKVWYAKGTCPHIQFNVVSTEVLREAQVKPEEHSDLIIRVAGYSAFFVDLPVWTQDSIIERTEQALR